MSYEPVVSDGFFCSIALPSYGCGLKILDFQVLSARVVKSWCGNEWWSSHATRPIPKSSELINTFITPVGLGRALASLVSPLLVGIQVDPYIDEHRSVDPTPGLVRSVLSGHPLPAAWALFFILERLTHV